MSHAHTAAGTDRLPWLADEPSAPDRLRSNRGANWCALAAILLVAGVSYCIGARSWEQSTSRDDAVRTITTVPLPQPRPSEPPPQPQAQPQVLLEVVPQVSPEPQRDVILARPHSEKRIAAAPSAGESPSATAAAPAEEKPSTTTKENNAPAPPVKTAASPADKPMPVWPAWQSQGAYGRIIRIGAFGSRLQAKLGWRYMVIAYPAVAHLKATVVADSNSRGRYFYRFQIGTTSQAHSEVLCQRMAKIHLSCAVVGLPWKPKGVER